MNDIEKIPAVPPMNINVASAKSEASSTVTDEDLQNIFLEILGDLRNDRREVDGLLSNFTEMVMNEGDSSSASKEAVVNLVKVKTDIADKKTKVADLMLALRMKEKSISKIQANQTNHIHITDKRAILDAINKTTKKVPNEQVE